ncbi:hypothetical protein C8039_10390 [Halogeometricum sp. wsp3]|nr:hypothetical protein C8039_10390 [Halogeometricum sp. wsp3]
MKWLVVPVVLAYFAKLVTVDMSLVIAEEYTESRAATDRSGRRRLRWRHSRYQRSRWRVPTLVEPEIPCDLVIDHSVQVDI